MSLSVHISATSFLNQDRAKEVGMNDGLGGMICVCCLGICHGYIFCAAIKI